MVRDLTDPFDRLRLFSMEAEDDGLGRISERVATGYLEQAAAQGAEDVAEGRDALLWTAGQPVGEMAAESCLWERMLPMEGLTLVAAPSMSGKSVFTFLLAAALHSGQPLARLPVDTAAGPLILATRGESTDAQLQTLSYRCGAATTVDGIYTPHFHRLLPSCFGSAAQSLRTLVKVRRQWPRALIVLDCWGSLFTGIDGNNANAVRDILTELKDAGGPWLLHHHCNKDKDKSGVDRIRNSTALVDGSDAILMAQRQGCTMTLTTIKRMAEHTVELTLPPGIGTPQSQDAEPQTEQVERMAPGRGRASRIWSGNGWMPMWKTPWER